VFGECDRCHDMFNLKFQLILQYVREEVLCSLDIVARGAATSRRLWALGFLATDIQ
jgi:hypothetical protein